MSRRPVVRTGKSDHQASSSEDEEDAFAALARKKKKNSKLASNDVVVDNNTAVPSTMNESVVACAGTNQKRHHHPSAARAAKMDMLLQELQETATNSIDQQAPTSSHATTHDRAPLEKMGSYCLPGEELITANLFVGNLAPCTTEEELAELFRQFGKRIVYYCMIHSSITSILGDFWV